MPVFDLKDIRTGKIDALLVKLYGKDELEEQRSRYGSLLEKGGIGRSKAAFFSSPGRTELGGNHTDHNHGMVLAGSIGLDKVAAAVPREDNVVEIVTEGFPEDIRADLSNLESRPSGAGRAAELVRGVAAYFASRGYGYGGFSAYVESRVAMGSGLSSSASLEVLIGKIFSSFYNDPAIPAVELSKAGQFAENNFFHKPCGLMDQLACAVGGIISIDFEKPGEPLVKQVDFDFRDHGYRLMIMDTGGDHADLTSEYASIPSEMKCVADKLGYEVLRDCGEDLLLEKVSELRKSCGDRAVLRALHFFQENRRVREMLEALNLRDMNGYLRLVKKSGLSSWTQLQNCMPTGSVKDQAVACSLGYLKEICPEGIFRVHGGGFAGTIQGYVPEDRFEDLLNRIERNFIQDRDNRIRVTPLTLRPEGVIQIGEE